MESIISVMAELSEYFSTYTHCISVTTFQRVCTSATLSACYVDYPSDYTLHGGNREMYQFLVSHDPCLDHHQQ